MVDGGRTILSEVRYRLSMLVPTEVKWWLLRQLFPGIVVWAAKFFQGIAPVWDADPRFRDLYDSISGRCLIDRKKAYVLFNCATTSKNIDGALAEVGVYRGATAKLILEATNYEKEFFGFDTFEGLPPTDETFDPYWKEGDLADARFEDVKSFLGSGGIRLIKGFFPDTASGLPHDTRFSLVHVDADIFRTTLDACIFFYPRMASTGLMVFDDYGFLSCPGVKKAIDEYFAERPEQPICVASGQCIVVKH